MGEKTYYDSLCHNILTAVTSCGQWYSYLTKETMKAAQEKYYQSYDGWCRIDNHNYLVTRNIQTAKDNILLTD